MHHQEFSVRPLEKVIACRKFPPKPWLFPIPRLTHPLGQARRRFLLLNVSHYPGQIEVRRIRVLGDLVKSFYCYVENGRSQLERAWALFEFCLYLGH